MNDVLKSLTVLDLGHPGSEGGGSHGTISSISYEAASGDSSRRARFGESADTEGEFDVNMLRCNSITDVLQQLRGVRVVCTLHRSATTEPASPIEGVVVAVERRSQQQTVQTILTLLIGAAVFRSLNLDTEVESVTIQDDSAIKGLQTALNEALQARKQDRKKITIFAEPPAANDASAARELLVSYVVQSPVWKTSYRVLLSSNSSGKEKGDDGAGTGLFQGWALVDNTQDEDWEGVSLSLVAGKPISFVQNLYQPLSTIRPRIPALGSGDGRSGCTTQMAIAQMLKKTFEMQPVLMKKRKKQHVVSDSDSSDSLSEEEEVGTFPSPPNKRKRMKRDRSRSRSRSRSSPRRDRDRDRDRRDKSDRRREGQEAATASVAVATRAPTSGDLFSYDIKNPVTVMRHQSGLVPIIQAPFNGERVALFNSETHHEYPLSALFFENDTGMTLEGGPVTVMEDDMYVGEAVLETTKPGEKRFVQFAVELGLIVTKTAAQPDPAPSFHKVHVAHGDMTLYTYSTLHTVYKVENRTGRDTILYLEHPKAFKYVSHRQPNVAWEIFPDKTSGLPEYSTNRFHGFRFNVAAKSTTEFNVCERAVDERVLSLMGSSLGGVDADTIRDWKRHKYIDDNIHAALSEVVNGNDKVKRLENQVAKLKAQESEIFANQNRLRQNLQATSSYEGEGLRRRYLDQLAKEEDTLLDVGTKMKQLTGQIDNLKQDLKKQVGGMSFTILLD